MLKEDKIKTIQKRIKPQPEANGLKYIFITMDLF